MERCPICNARLRGQEICPRCQAELYWVIRIAQRNQTLNQECLAALQNEKLAQARQAADEAVFLRRTPMSQALSQFSKIPSMSVTLNFAPGSTGIIGQPVVSINWNPNASTNPPVTP
jgi:hypothetical protein